MNTKSLSIALAALAGFAGAQAPATPSEDATARQQAAQASQLAAKASTEAASAAGQAKLANETNATQGEKIDAVDGKLTGLEEAFLETKATVDALKKLKISGLVQAQAVFYTDTNIVSAGARSQQQSLMQVRRGRLKATYDAGNGSVYVMQYNLNQTGLSAQDLYVKWDEPWLKTFSLQAGLQDIPFGYEVSYSSSVMEVLERSRFERNAMFKDEKDVGFILGIAPAVPGLDAFGIKLAALNGYGLADATFDPKCFVGRINVGKNFYDIGTGVDLGASYYADSRQNGVAAVRNKANTTDSIPSAYFEIDGSADFKKNGTFRKDVDAQVIGIDGQVAIDVSMVPGLAGAKLSGELYTGSAIGDATGNTRTAYGTTLYKRELMGWYATYVQNIGKSFQTVVRYDVYDPNTSVSGDEIGDKTANGGKGNGTSKADLAYDTWYFGLNVFLNGNTKVTLGYDLVKNETTKNLPSAVPASNFTEEIKDDIVTLRAQFAF